jgi:hypothetical protein
MAIIGCIVICVIFLFAVTKLPYLAHNSDWDFGPLWDWPNALILLAGVEGLELPRKINGCDAWECRF